MVITGDEFPGSHLDQCQMALDGGARLIQLRMKNTPVLQMYTLASEAVKICHRYQAHCIINDHLEICRDAGADGIHLGLSDLSPAQARLELPPTCIVGGTVNTAMDIAQRKQEKVDYVGCGPFRQTHTKKNLAPILGLVGLRQLKSLCTGLPFFAIGGIQLPDLPFLFQTGINGVAVSSAIFNHSNPTSQTQLFLEAIHQSQQQTPPQI